MYENCIRLAQLTYAGTSSATPVDVTLANAALPLHEPLAGESWMRAFEDALASLLSDTGWVGREMVLSLPSSLMGYRRMRLTAMPDAELPQAVHWRAAKELSVSVKDLQTGHYDIGEVDDAGRRCRDVIAVSAATADVERFVEVAEKLKYPVLAVDAAVGSLARALASSLHNARTIMMVEVGVTSSAVIVAREGIPCFIRTIPGGRNLIIERTAARLGCGPDETQLLWQVLEDDSKLDLPSDQTLHVLCEVAMLHAAELAHEVKLCVHYMLSLGQRDSEPELGCVIGAGPQEAIFLRKIKEACDVPCLPLDQWLPASLQSQIEQQNPQGSHDAWLTTLGLCMRGRSIPTREELAA